MPRGLWLTTKAISVRASRVWWARSRNETLETVKLTLYRTLRFKWAPQRWPKPTAVLLENQHLKLTALTWAIQMIREQIQKAWTFKTRMKSLHLKKVSLHRWAAVGLPKLKKQLWQKTKFQRTSKQHNQTLFTPFSRLRAATTVYLWLTAVVMVTTL